jgi:hypothetical protein
MSPLDNCLGTGLSYPTSLDNHLGAGLPYPTFNFAAPLLKHQFPSKTPEYNSHREAPKTEPVPKEKNPYTVSHLAAVELHP